jgi:hypothetical protein
LSSLRLQTIYSFIMYTKSAAHIGWLYTFFSPSQLHIQCKPSQLRTQRFWCVILSYAFDLQGDDCALEKLERSPISYFPACNGSWHCILFWLLSSYTSYSWRISSLIKPFFWTEKVLFSNGFGSQLLYLSFSYVEPISLA